MLFTSSFSGLIFVDDVTVYIKDVWLKKIFEATFASQAAGDLPLSWDAAVCVCVCDDLTCPTGGDTTLPRLVLELSLGLAEWELQGGLEQHRFTNREAYREVGHTCTPGQKGRDTFGKVF